ncbi:flagella basal body P-ring formation protein FlgA [Iodobacter arcticus]|uniref:Flagella basal body P-ring formation protein FlgA n=1 Tax=Iodobacter arcticus TaxID=590593 RepID=A0ABW2QVM6_9NEIS
MKKILGKFSNVILYLMFSSTSAYSIGMENIPLEEKVRNFAQNYFEITAKNHFNRKIFLTVSLIPPRDISQLNRCESPPLLAALQGEDSALLKIDVSCTTGKTWNARYMARAMYRLKEGEDEPLRAFTSNTTHQIASSPQPAGYLIKKGKEIELVARAELVEIRSKVVAEESGRLGEVIWVRNKRSGKKIRAVVSSEQEVSPP